MKSIDKPKILMLTLGHGCSVVGGLGGGTENSGKLLVDRLRLKGFNITVIGCGGDISFISPPVLWRSWWAVSALIVGTFALLTREFDVIYARYSTYPMFVGVILKYLFGKKLVASIHGGDIRHSGVYKTLITFCLRLCDIVVCYDNPEHEEELRSRGIRPFVIPNGVDTKEFKPRRGKHSNVHVVYLGGKREIKGYYDMLSACGDEDLLRSRKLKIDMYDGEDIASRKIGGYRIVEHHEPIPQDKMKDVMEAGQLFVLPSHQEGVPGALLQAMSSGMFVIASDLPFTRKVVDGRFLFKAGDMAAIVKLIAKFRDDKSRYFKLQNKKNRELIVRNYSIDRTVSMWTDLFGRFA